MSNSQPSNTRFWFIAVLVLLATAGGLAALWPLARVAAHAESAALVREGDSATGAEAANDYLLATRLNSGNTQAFARLANSQISAGQPDAALASLTRAGQGSDVEQLKVRTLIELSRYNAAASEAVLLTQPGRSDSDVVLAALAYATAGQPTAASPLAQHVASPQAAQRVLRAAGSKLTLAAELSASGLLNSSNAILTSLPVSFERNLLLARIYYIRHTPADLTQAAALLTVALPLQPANPDAHTLLARVYREQNQLGPAQLQDALATKLSAGRP